MKKCNICNEIKDESDFYQYNVKNSKGIPHLYIQPYCKSCCKQKHMDWYRRNKEKAKISYDLYNNSDIGRARSKENSRRRRENGSYAKYQQSHSKEMKEYRLNRESHKTHNISKEEWEECKKYFNYQCAYCGLSLEDHYIKYKQEIRKSDFHKEHVINDGANNLSNCVPSCKVCNSLKHDLELEEWYRKQSFFSEEKLNKIYKWLNEDYKQYIKPPKPKGKYVRKKDK